MQVLNRYFYKIFIKILNSKKIKLEKLYVKLREI